MTETVLKEIVHRAVRDGSYRAQLQSDPAGALAGYSLTAEERSAIASGDPTRLTALGVDQRMSKAFAAGVLGDASKTIIAYEPGPGAAVVDEAAQTVRSPMWRIEQDLDTTGAVVSDDAKFDAAGLRPFERESGAPVVASEPESVRSPMWRIEQELHGDTARIPEETADASGAALTEFEYAGEAAKVETTETVRSPMWRIEQDLDAGDSLKSADGGAETNADGPQITEY